MMPPESMIMRPAVTVTLPAFFWFDPFNYGSLRRQRPHRCLDLASVR